MKRLAQKSLLLLTVLSLILFALPFTALADGGTAGNELIQTVDGYKVTLVFEKPASVGENQIRVLVSDAMNMPVSQADVEVSVVDAEAAHTEGEPTAQAGTMPEQSVEPTTQSSKTGMGGMDAQPTAEAGTMTMSAQPTAEIGTMTMSEQPAGGHDAMGMDALAAGHESGEYEGQLGIETNGDVTIRVHLTVQGKLMEVDFPLHVAKSNTGAFVLTGFFTVNATIIAAAVAMKRKPVSVEISKKA